MSIGQSTVNNQADINKIKLKTVTLDYINPSCVDRQFEFSMGMVDSKKTLFREVITECKYT